MDQSLYYREFAGRLFVIQAEAEAVDNQSTTRAVLQGIGELLGHGIRVALVFGKGTAFDEELRSQFGACRHAETNRLLIPENALVRVRQQRQKTADAIASLCRFGNIPCQVFSASVVQAERRIGHASTGIVTAIDAAAIRAVLDEGRLAILGFGGEDQRGQFLHVSSVSLAAELAVRLGAQKLLFLMQADGIFLPGPKGGAQQLSFADLEQLLCLLQRQDQEGRFVLSGAIVPKVHASIRAVAGGVDQVHLVSYARLLDEVLTRTGVGTMIEQRQSHHVDYARPEDLDEIERLHREAQSYTTALGTPYVKPLDRAALARLVPRTLLLKHRGIVIGKLHAGEVPVAPQFRLIGGFAIGENHQDSQQGQLLLCEALGRLREEGCAGAVAITASERAKRLFERCGGVPTPGSPWQSQLLQQSLARYHPDERDQVRLFEFLLR